MSSNRGTDATNRHFTARLLSGVLVITALAIHADAPLTAAPAKGDKPAKRDAAKPAVLVEVMDKTGRVIFGELASEDGPDIVVIDLRTKAKKTISKKLALSVKRDITDASAIRSTSLGTMIAYKLGKLGVDESKPAKGKVAKVTLTSIYLTLGKDSGVRVGDEMAVYRDEGEIKDPDTGEVLASGRAKVAMVRIIEVQPKFSKAKPVGGLDVRPQVGDMVEVPAKGLRVAVFPLVNTAGQTTEAGEMMAEQLTTELVKAGVTVVERARLGAALAELAIQQSALVDAQSAQKVGRLLGATVVLTGKIVGPDHRPEAHVRLIDITTGKILLAGAERLPKGVSVAVAGSGGTGGKPAATRKPTSRFTKAGPPPDDRIIAEDERKQDVYRPRTYRKEVRYELAVKPGAPQKRLLDTWVSFKMNTEPLDSTGKVLMSIDYAKTWIELERWSPQSLRDMARSKNWRHIQLRTAGYTRTDKREIAKLSNTKVDVIYIQFERVNYGGLGLDTVVWWE